MKPRFAIEAHLAALFAQEAQEQEEAKEEPSAHDNGGEQEIADGGRASSVGCLSSTASPGVDALMEPCPPRHLPTALDEALQEEVTTGNSGRHDWIERLGEPDRRIIRGKYRRMADFWVSTTDPDATMMNSKGEGTRLGYHTHSVVDGGKARIILAALVTPSEVMENQPGRGSALASALSRETVAPSVYRRYHLRNGGNYHCPRTATHSSLRSPARC